ncbi:MAG: hypothetical protein ACK47D_00540 [Pseudanabaena sp.]|jgi:hypothetical protein
MNSKPATLLIQPTESYFVQEVLGQLPIIKAIVQQPAGQLPSIEAISR